MNLKNNNYGITSLTSLLNLTMFKQIETNRMSPIEILFVSICLNLVKFNNDVSEVIP
jgi:hypothetical protein